MTQYTDEQIKLIKETVIDKKVIDFYYEKDGDYYVMKFEDNTETSFRFMADLIK